MIGREGSKKGRRVLEKGGEGVGDVGWEESIKRKSGENRVMEELKKAKQGSNRGGRGVKEERKKGRNTGRNERT